jgi:ribonuclease BN (tRNA processing enzyme)
MLRYWYECWLSMTLLSGSPSFTRNVSSYALRLHDEIWLFDCGEARAYTRPLLSST